MRTGAILALACAAACALPRTSSMAQPPPNRGEGGPGEAMAEAQQARLNSELGLNTNQADAIRKIMYDTRSIGGVATIVSLVMANSGTGSIGKRAVWISWAVMP